MTIRPETAADVPAVRQVVRLALGRDDEARLVELPDPNYSSYIIDTMGRPLRATAGERERTAAPNLAQALRTASG